MQSSAYLFCDGVRPLTAPLVIPLQLRVESLAQASLVVVAWALSLDYVRGVGKRVVLGPVELQADVVIPKRL